MQFKITVNNCAPIDASQREYGCCTKVSYNAHPTSPNLAKLLQVFVGLTPSQMASHQQILKFIKVNLTLDHLIKCLILGLKSQRLHGDMDFFQINDSTVVLNG